MSQYGVQRPTAQDVFRYRYQHGTNLGGIFVLEKWLFPSMFDPSAADGSELDAVVASLNIRGLDQTRQKWEAHWDAALTDTDMDWLTNIAHCNCIRLPIGYFTLGPAFCMNTPFAAEPAQVYINAWSFVESLIERCFWHGIGVLVDFHAAPGGANAGNHSGTSSHRAELWEDEDNLELTIKCLEFIAHQVTGKAWSTAVVGLGVINEAIWKAPGLYTWYTGAIERISAINSTLPLHISDAWNLDKTFIFSLRQNSATDTTKCPVIVDCHRYFAFAKHHTEKSPHELIKSIPTTFDRLQENTNSWVFDIQTAGSVFVGEYSCVMSEKSWKQVPTEQRKDLMRQFGTAQTQEWQTATSGSAFWTYRMDWGDGGGWGFRQQTNDGAIKCPRTMDYTAGQVESLIVKVDQTRGTLLHQAFFSHMKHWRQTSPDGKFEHWRYVNGWNCGWNDAKDFFVARYAGMLRCAKSADHKNGDPPKHGALVTSLGLDGTVTSMLPQTKWSEVLAADWVGADTIGALNLWILKRMKEAGVLDKQRCPQGWEWEHGFRAAVRSFKKLVETSS